MSDGVGYSRAIARLVRNGLRLRVARLRTTPLKPEVVSLAVTNRCNSHCIMCGMWKSPGSTTEAKAGELTVREMVDLFSRPLFSELKELDLTGGEPHLRDDLADIALSLAALKRTHLPHLRTIVLTSNGLLPNEIVSNYRRILEDMKGSGIDLVSVASLDGIGDVHDAVRGTKGAFGLASRTIDGLLRLRTEYPGYFVGLKTTVLPVNVDSLDDILAYAEQRGLFTIISPVFFTETRFRNAATKEGLDLGSADLEKLLSFYQRADCDANYFYSRIGDLFSCHRKSWSCTAAYNYLFIESDGTVFPCELLSRPLGNIRQQPIEQIWRSEEADQARGRTERTERCRACIEPGAVRYSAYAEGLAYAGHLTHLGRHRYQQSLLDEGYCKYF
jgi:MoaA/NifB/PqqE/SkfB family radical SAM enzyme